MFNRKRKSTITKAKVISSDENKLVIEVDSDMTKYRRGQMVVATVSTKEKTATGKMVLVSDVVAQGPIEEVVGKKVTICSAKKNPIVSRRAALEAKENAKKVSVRVLH